MVEPDRPKMTRTACWTPKATDANSQYVILTAFPVQQWLYKRASMLRYSYIAYPVFSHHRHVIWWPQMGKKNKESVHYRKRRFAVLRLLLLNLRIKELRSQIRCSWPLHITLEPRSMISNNNATDTVCSNKKLHRFLLVKACSVHTGVRRDSRNQLFCSSLSNEKSRPTGRNMFEFIH